MGNESHGQITDESHFHVHVVCEAFEGLSRIARHRLVNKLCSGGDGALKFHALRLTVRTPEQWDKSAAPPEAPKCTGRGDGRGPTDLSQI
eukprot:NODE_7393_length_443_cov_160.605670.p4 GENE.NODE_7393_length_443_cov_160.605670~~NODE_7393_length_443_cov_160.605670.p4  ORF type:complete len:90 (+),score=33.38 NODE_7393_length_443_cov_160.605670:3-272(+)